MADSKVASLSSALLARKGGARPASWSQSGAGAMLAEVDPALGEEIAELPDGDALENSGDGGEARLQASHIKRGQLSVIEGDKARDERTDSEETAPEPERSVTSPASVAAPAAAQEKAEPDRAENTASVTSKETVTPPPATPAQKPASEGQRIEPALARPRTAAPTTPAAPSARRSLEGSVRHTTPPPKRTGRNRLMLAGLGVLIVAGVAAGFAGGDGEPETTTAANSVTEPNAASVETTPAPATATTDMVPDATTAAADAPTIETMVESAVAPEPAEVPNETVANEVAEVPPEIVAETTTKTSEPVQTVLAEPEANLESFAADTLGEPLGDAGKPAQETAPAEVAALPDATQPPADITSPSVDVIRVKGDGSAVLAGRGPAGTDWIVMHNDAPLGVVTINQFGEWVFLPTQTLPKGAHEFSLVRKKPESTVALPPAKKAVAEPSPAAAAPDVPLQPKPIGPDASIEEPESGAPLPVLRPREKLSDAGSNGNV